MPRGMTVTILIMLVRGLPEALHRAAFETGAGLCRQQPERIVYLGGRARGDRDVDFEWRAESSAGRRNARESVAVGCGIRLTDLQDCRHRRTARIGFTIAGHGHDSPGPQDRVEENDRRAHDRVGGNGSVGDAHGHGLEARTIRDLPSSGDLLQHLLRERHGIRAPRNARSIRRSNARADLNL